MEQSGKVPPPYPLAMVICDAIWRDPSTGKRFLLGCFSVIHAQEFPATHPLLAVHVSVTNGRGKVPLKLQLVSVPDDEMIWNSESQEGEERFEMEFTDPRIVAEFDFHMGGIEFPHPGEYRFQLFMADEFIMERRLLVNKLPEPEQ